MSNDQPATDAPDDDTIALSAVVLALLIVACPLAAVAATWLVAGRTLPLVGILVAVTSIACAVRPASHLGVVVVAVVTIQWVVVVDQRTTAWTLAAAVALVGFHAAMAAATIAPPTAPWSPAVRRRWTRRSLSLAGACAAMWGLVRVVDSLSVASSSILAAAALIVLASGAIWTLHGRLRPPAA